MTEPLTILTWLWAQPGGRTRYSAIHVNVWADMVDRHLSLPHRLACVTDCPQGIDRRVAIIAPPRDFESVRIPTWGDDKPQCFRRLSLFRRDAGAMFGSRFVSMDLDCVIAASLDSLFSRGEDIVLYASPSGSIPNPRPYNGSMLLMTAGARPQVFDRFTPQAAADAGRKFIGSDQAWISDVLGRGEATFDETDGVVWWGRRRARAAPRIMFFPGCPKPWDLLDHDDWIRKHYRGSRSGRCLILGHAPTVWDEARQAMHAGPFDAVIACPEAARHWPGRIDAVAADDDEAGRTACMLGFDDVTFCGRSGLVAA